MLEMARSGGSTSSTRARRKSQRLAASSAWECQTRAVFWLSLLRRRPSLRGERGTSVVEYGLLVACVAVFFLTALILIDVLGAVFESGACEPTRGYQCTEVP